MLEIRTNRFGGKMRTFDLHDLPIGETFAHKLPQPDLYKELLKLGIPGVVPTMGHQDMSLLYGNFLAEQKERAA